MKVAILVDLMGGGGKEREDEIADHKKHLALLFPGVAMTFTEPYCAMFPEHPDLILFDYGGMFPGSDLLGSNSRSILDYVAENPNALLIVCSSFSWMHGVEYEMVERGLDPDTSHNVAYDGEAGGDIVTKDPVPEWFRQKVGCPAPVTDDLRPARVGDSLPNGRTMPETIPSAKFFEPNDAFFNHMRAFYGDDRIYDVGAGDGHVSAGLISRSIGRYVLPIDLHPREKPDMPVTISDGTMHNYESRSTVMLCRPCHGEFVHWVAMRAISCKCARVVYVGLPKNRANDLGALGRRFKRVATKVGAEGEAIYVMEIPRAD